MWRAVGLCACTLVGRLPVSYAAAPCRGDAGGEAAACDAEVQSDALGAMQVRRKSSPSSSAPAAAPEKEPALQTGGDEEAAAQRNWFTRRRGSSPADANTSNTGEGVVLDTDATYTLENVHAPGRYLNVEGNGQHDGANVHLWSNPWDQATQWRFSQVADEGPGSGSGHLETPVYTIESVNAPGKFLNTQGNWQHDGANIVLWSNPKEASTQWRLLSGPNSSFTIESMHAEGKYLNAAGNWWQNGANIHLWDNPAAASTQWRIAKAKPPSFWNYRYDARCFGNVGSAGCRRNNRSSGSCVCKDGCMGADGSCWDRENKVIGSGFTLRNKKWPKYKMYVQSLSAFGQVKSTKMPSWMNMRKDKFDLYELPGTLDGQRQFFLSSDRWTDHVVNLQLTGGTALTLWGAYAVDLAAYHQPWDLREVMLNVCSARSRGHPDAIMVGSSTKYGGSTVWAFLKELTFLVFGFWYPERQVITKITSLGASSASPVPMMDAYWVPNPPFEEGVLPDCPPLEA